MRTVPVRYSARPLPGGCERNSMMSIFLNPSLAVLYSVVLFPQSFESVRQFRSPISFVCELGDEHPERLGVSGDGSRSSVHRIETHAAAQLSDHTFATLVVAALQ